jgi:dihydropyrimidinase
MHNTQVDTIVHGGTVATSTSAFEASVAIKDGKFTAIGPQESMPPADAYIDATGKYVLPGLIDCHVHLGTLDTWDNGTVGAAQSGLTTIIPFALYEGPSQGTFADVATRIIEEASSSSVVDFTLHFILTNDPTTVHGLEDAISMGITSFKMFMTYKKRRNRMCSDEHLLQAMEVIAGNGAMLQIHAENGDIIEYLENKAMTEGRVKPVDYPATAPPIAEAEAINRVITLAQVTECPLYIVHLTTKAGLERIKQAQAMGQRVWTETCPQYMLLSEEAHKTFGPFAKIGPPLRSADLVNQNALWEGSAQGYIATVGSDHSVYPKEDKERGWDNIFVSEDGQSIPFGAPSMETLVPLMYSEGVVKRGLPIWWMARVLAENPARLFGIYPRKGVIRPGADADVLIWNPDTERTIREADLCGRAGFTPYDGWLVQGSPWITLLRGKVLLQDGKLHQHAGYGQFLPAGSPVPPVAGPVR